MKIHLDCTTNVLSIAFTDLEIYELRSGKAVADKGLMLEALNLKEICFYRDPELPVYMGGQEMGVC